MKIIFSIIVAFYYLNSFGQNQPQNVINNFFNIYKERNSDAALDYLFSTNRWITESQKDR